MLLNYAKEYSEMKLRRVTKEIKNTDHVRPFTRATETRK